MHSLTANSTTCDEGRSYANDCGCDMINDTTTTESEPTDPPTEDQPVEEQTSGSEKKGTCTLCLNGAPVGYPDMDLTGVLLELAASYADVLNELDDVVLTCGLLDELLASGFFDCEELDSARLFAAGICGCPPNGADFCNVCPNDDEFIPYTRQASLLWPWNTFQLDKAPTCEQMRRGIDAI
jgi:hypothetical protein